MKKPISAILAALLIVLCVCPAFAAADDGRTVVIAGSDFQNKNGDAEGAATVEAILSQMKGDGIDADGLLFCGDYSVQLGAANQKALCESGIQTLKASVAKYMPNAEHQVFLKGNHDYSNTEGLSPKGANDTDDYGVFVIHEDMYKWQQNGPSHSRLVRKTATELASYLRDKANANYRKPIFVLSHLALDYSMRTYNDGDAMFAEYLFTELNKYAEKGLTIVYLFGHDHSHGWDNYLGGSSVYLGVGDTIMIADPEDKTAAPSAKTLAFTYMNAGYTGYYDSEEGDDSPVDKTLTMTAFSFGDGEMEISRYDAEGLHALKSEGFYNARKDNQEETLGYYSPDKRVIKSRVTVCYNPFTDVKPKDWFAASVDSVFRSGLFAGTTKATFSPLDSTTRCMLVSVLWRAAGEPTPTGTNPFTDVKAKSWYGPAVIWAEENGVVSGTAKGRFDPDGKITREQIALILYNYTYSYVNKYAEKPAAQNNLTAFPDASSVSSWAKTALSWAVSQQLVTGAKQGTETYLVPRGLASRAEVAAILSRYVNTEFAPK